MKSRPILVVHPSADARQRLTSLLATHEVLEAASREEALPQLVARAPRMVLAQAEDFRRLMKDLERHCPDTIRAVLWSSQDADKAQALVDLVAQGQSVFTVPVENPEATAHAIDDLLQTRRSLRQQSREPLLVTFKIGGQDFSGAVAELSNEGMGIAMAPTPAIIDSTSPGVTMEDLKAHQGGRVVFTAPCATVQTLRLAGEHRKVYLHVGVSLVAREPAAGVARQLNQTLTIRGLLKRAARHQSTFKVRPVDDERICEFNQATPSTDGSTLELNGPRQLPPPLQSGQQARLFFELGGVNYSGHTFVIQTEPTGRTVCALPNRVTELNRRNSLRFAPSREQPFSVSFISPLSQVFFHRPVLDLQTSGFSFLLDASTEALPPGLIIDSLTLALPDGTKARCRAEVMALGSAHAGMTSQAGRRPRRCGLRFLYLPANARKAILDAFVKVRCADALDGGEVPFSSILELTKEVGAAYPDYPLEDGPHREVLARTHALLAQGDHGICKTFIYQKEGQVTGHISGLRCYSRSWLAQHLMVKPGYHRQNAISQELLTLSSDYVEGQQDIDYVRIFWRTRNRWTARIYGAIASRMKRPGLTTVSSFTPARLPLDKPLPPPAPGLRVRPATDDDVRFLVRHLLTTVDVVRLRSLELNEEELSLASLGRRYAAHGLVRGREIAVVEDGHEPLGFALMEKMTPGLFWAEWFNGFSLILPGAVGAEPARADALRLALLHHAQQTYRARGGRVLEILAVAQDLPLLEQLGFASLGEVMDWTAHRSQLRIWHNHISAVFEKLDWRNQRRSERASAAALEEEDEAA